MGQHGLLPHRTVDITELGRQLARGAAIGLAVGVLLIAIGVLRAAVFLLTGGHLPTLSWEDARLAAFYVGGFGLAGAVVGAVVPRLRTAVGLYVAFSVAGMIVVTAIMASEKGGLRARDRVDWILLMPIGAIFGCAFAYGWSKRT